MSKEAGRAGSSGAFRLYFRKDSDNMLKKLMAMCGIATESPHLAPVPFAAVDDSLVQKRRTPDEAKARRKAYKRRKAAKAARRRNRR